MGTAILSWIMVTLPWTFVQLGWIAGPFIVILFSIVTFFTSNILSQCLLSSENHIYSHAIRTHLGETNVKIYRVIKYTNRLGAINVFLMMLYIRCVIGQLLTCFVGYCRKYCWIFWIQTNNQLEEELKIDYHSFCFCIDPLFYICCCRERQFKRNLREIYIKHKK